jgi:hypothetical protein
MDMAVRTKRYDVKRVMKGADDLLERTENPLHRAILKNYRRHALLEIAGRWQELLTPEFMADNPHYSIMTPAGTTEYKGRSEVAKFYSQIADAGLTVFGAVDDSEKLAVGDWGFASEAVFGHIVPGPLMASMGQIVTDLDAHYLICHRTAMVWSYDRKAKCMGENVYDDLSSYQVQKMLPEDVITPAMATHIIEGMLETRTLDVL